MNWQTIAAIAAVVLALLGGGIVFYAETQTQGAAIGERTPWIEKWLDTREKRVEDNQRRVERLESLMMEKRK